MMSIFLSNIFYLPPYDGITNAAMYETWSYVEHSCDGNCILSFGNDPKSFVCYCRTTRHIKVGEPLTACKIENPFEPTTDRRVAVIGKFGFTCHCPRCDAAGDDTRQFECFDCTCLGRHYVREPVQGDSCTVEGFSHTFDVPYEPPHLLACTICHRTPPAQYQEHCLHTEKHLIGALERIRRASAVPGADFFDLIRQVLTLSLPPLHSLHYHACMLRVDLDIYRTENNPLAPTFPPNFNASMDANAHAAKDAETILPTVTDALLNVWSQYMVTTFTSRAPPTVIKRVVQHFLRLHFVAKGRDNRMASAEAALVNAQKQVPVPQEVVDMAVCAFCEESPQRAALTLAQCARCRKVVYCSKGCQKAHWPLHKVQCGK